MLNLHFLNVPKNLHPVNLSRSTFCSPVSSSQVCHLSLFSFLHPFPVPIPLFYQPSSFVSLSSTQQSASLCSQENASDLPCLTWNPAIRGNWLELPPPHLPNHPAFSFQCSCLQYAVWTTSQPVTSLYTGQLLTSSEGKTKSLLAWSPFPIINTLSHSSHLELQLWKQGHIFSCLFPLPLPLQYESSLSSRFYSAHIRIIHFLLDSTKILWTYALIRKFISPCDINFIFSSLN